MSLTHRHLPIELGVGILRSVGPVGRDDSGKDLASDREKNV